MDIHELWEWVQRIAGILLVVCVCLYAVRCVAAGDFVDADRFYHFLRGLVRYFIN